MHAYCKTNDILISAPTMKAAQAYAEYRLSPAYGHPEGRANNLRLVRINKARADELDGFAITWEVTA